MKKRLTVLIIAFSISFLLLVSLSLFSVKRVDALIDFSNKADHSNFILRDLYTLQGFVKDLDRSERGYMLTMDTLYSNGYLHIKDSIKNCLAQLNIKGRDDKELISDLSILEKKIKKRCDYISENFALVDSTHSSTPTSIYFDGRKIMRECANKIRDMMNDEKQTFDEVYRNEHFYMQVAGDTLKYLLFIFFVATIILFLMMLTEFRKRIKFQHALQQRIWDLKQSQIELEQIALSASHDLREPLRKIRVFINRLLWIKKDQLDEDSKSTFERVNKYALKMQELIEDLVNLTSLGSDERAKEWVDTPKVLKSVMLDLNEKIVQKQVCINPEDLPKIFAYNNQVYILFRCLLDNAISNISNVDAPEIMIKDVPYNPIDFENANMQPTAKNYKVISFIDNGIGFENMEKGKLVPVYNHLNFKHSSYDGKGVSMAICQRIMNNHEGYILVENKIAGGANIKLYFPEEV